MTKVNKHYMRSFLAEKFSPRSSMYKVDGMGIFCVLLPSAAALNQEGILQITQDDDKKEKKNTKAHFDIKYLIFLLLNIWHKYVHFYFSVIFQCEDICEGQEAPIW